MEVSEDLLNAYRSRLRETPPAPEKVMHELMDLWGEYETACALSRGPDAGRSEHWRQKALSLAHQLRGRLGLRAVEPRRKRRAAG